MLTVHHSNRLEHLLDRLIAVSAVPLADALAPEVIVTQSQGMARWLAYGIAERRGVAALLKFDLPAAFVWRVFSTQLPDVPSTSAYDRDALTWRLMGLLPQWLDKPGFEPLARYLAGERRERKLFQLCTRLADVYDQYLIYRPQMVLDWERGAGDDWQAPLWRALVESAGGAIHRAALWSRFRQLCDRGGLDTAKLPARVCIFGIPALPPAYLDVIARLAEATEVHLFLLNPCREYWGDIEAPRSLAWRRAVAARRGHGSDDDYRTSGNRLLAAMGKQGRDFLESLHAHTLDEREDFDEPAGTGLLATLQRDILDLCEFTPAADDGSLQVHACHGPMREVEVLHDRLLDLFQRDATLTPRDVIVMTPDIETYAPYVEAVFGAAEGTRHIPFAIADLSRRSSHPVVQAFLQLLDLAGSRFAASEVLSLLEVPAVLRRFGLDLDDFDAIRRWVSESGIRWGLDGRGRAGLDLPATDDHTWEFGFRRLFLGYALPPGDHLVHGVLPYGDVEGQGAAALGRLRSFVEGLENFRRRLQGHYDAPAWAALGNDLLDTFFRAETDDAEPLQIIREALADLVDEAERGGFADAFGLDVLRDRLRGSLDEPSAGHHFLTGPVTFCAMVPMRSLPFRVVCLLGMNDGAFPRRHRPVGFDKMAADPKPGDRSRREDDRYLFLEALLSARERFYVSYVGRNIRDNSPMLPSVLVSELLDYLEQGYGKELRERVLTEHPLQPFSARYFHDDARLFSYADEWLPGVRARRGDRIDAAAFCPEPLSVGAEASTLIDLADLLRFFRHPTRAFLRDRLGVFLDEDGDVLEDSEPFAVDGLTHYALKQEILDHVLHDGATEHLRPVLKGRGMLPDGPFAELALEDALAPAAALAERVAAHPVTREPVEVAVTLGDHVLVGWLGGLGEEGLVRHRVGSLRAQDRLTFWIEHLALCCSVGDDHPCISRFIAENETVRFNALEGARKHLAALTALFLQGQSQPLHLFPRSACAYAEAVRKNGKAEPINAARGAWNDGFGGRPGEGGDPYYRVAYRSEDPLDDSFTALALQVFEPLLNAQQQDDA